MAKNIHRVFACIFAAGLAAACQPRPSTDRLTQHDLAATQSATTPSPNSAQTQATTAHPARSAPLAADALSDTVITARIKAGILADPGMAGSDVSVNTDGGVVQLTGIIKSQEQAAIASAHAQRQDGVLRVDDHLSVNLQ